MRIWYSKESIKQINAVKSTVVAGSTATNLNMYFISSKFKIICTLNSIIKIKNIEYKSKSAHNHFN